MMFWTAKTPTGPRRMAALPAALTLAVFGLAACSLDTSPAPFTSANPNVFYARLAQDDLSGVYDPAGYTSADVQKGLAQVCGSRRITGYREEPAGDMVAFFGHCWGGTHVGSGRVTFWRMGNRLRIEVPGYIGRDSRDEARHWSIRL